MKPLLTAVFVLGSLSSAQAAQPAAPAATTPPAYARAATLVDIGGGRRLNLRCEGDGPRTVVLEAGGNADASTWFRVMPLLASTSRVCAYDRAGYGFSDPGPLPRNLDADVADLRALLRAAKIELPVVLVGHSLGSDIVRRHALRHPEDVAGLVLLDPPEHQLASHMPAQWKQQADAASAQRDAFLKACADAAKAGTLSTSTNPALQGCLRAPPPWMSAEVAAAVRSSKLKPGYWATLGSELHENAAIFDAPVEAAGSLGALPMVVLAAGRAGADAPPELRAGLQAARTQTQQAIVAQSSRASVRTVADASHEIQIDQPQAVADAVRDVLAQTKASAKHLGGDH